MLPVLVVLFPVLAYAGVNYAVLAFVVYAITAAGLGADTRAPAPAWVRKLAPLSTLTYGVYMLHPVMEKVLVGALGHRILDADREVLILLALLAAAATFVAAYVSYEIFERPVRRWISGLRWGRANSRTVPL